MNKKHSIRALRLLALALTASLLLTGCMILSPMVLFSGETETAATDAVPSSMEPPVPPATGEPVPATSEEPTPSASEPLVDPDDEALIRWQNAGGKDYLPEEPVDMVPFSRMEYVRPDVETLCADFDALTAKAKDSDDAEALLERFYELYTRYVSFYSMDCLANIKYSQNTTESRWKDEYDFCENETPKVEEKLEALYKGFAASPARDALEEAYFGSGFFTKYDDYEVYTNPEYLRLSQEEAALLSEYRALTADPKVTFNGQTKTLEEWLDTARSAYEYYGAVEAYYDEYNSSIGEVFVKLVKVRRQLAAALDYDNYADYSYEMSYHRDYTPEDGDGFLKGIREYLVPVYEEAQEDPRLASLSTGSSTEASVMDMVRTAAENIGGSVWDAFRFMQAYELCDISQSPVKIESSFQIYLYDWEAPFVLLNAQGSGSDYLSFSHEFGHFTDAFHNYGANADLETSETFSQSMEFLALRYTDTLSRQQKNSLIQYELLDILKAFVYQGAYADFEARVYALNPDEITVEKVNELYLQCLVDYGLYTRAADFFYADFYEFCYSRCWIETIHFFEVPYYIISYCVSAETALQVYRLEESRDGEGVAAYFRLLDRDYEAGVQQVMEDAGLENPFREEVLKQTADFFMEKLGLE